MLTNSEIDQASKDYLMLARPCARSEFSNAEAVFQQLCAQARANAQGEAVAEFEVVDRHNCRHRFDKKLYRWCWGVQAGTIDRDDHNLVVVFDRPTDDDTEAVIVKEFPFASLVGDVGIDECLLLREIPIERCPRCAYTHPAPSTLPDSLPDEPEIIETMRKNLDGWDNRVVIAYIDVLRAHMGRKG